MRILILHQHFKEPASGGALRSYFLARALVEAGHHPIVITGSNEKKYRHTIVDGIEVHQLPIAYDNAFGFYRRSVSFLKYIFRASALARRIRGIDLCYAISVPLTIGIAARWLKFTRSIPYIFEVGDLWPDAPIQMGVVKSVILRKMLEQLERSIYRESSALVALSPSMRDALVARAPGKKVLLVPNMADCAFFQPTARQENQRLVVSYIGAIGLANGLDYFIEIANLSRKASLPVHFILCGDGALLERLKRNAKHLGLSNITFTGFVNRDGVREVMDKTDVVFVSYKNLPVLQTGSPNKFFDGLAAGKMIMINFGGWIREEIESTRCGVYVDAADPTDFKRKIEPFLSRTELLEKYKEASRQLAMKYDRSALTRQWVEEIKKIVHSKL